MIIKVYWASSMPHICEIEVELTIIKKAISLREETKQQVSNQDGLDCDSNNFNNTRHFGID